MLRKSDWLWEYTLLRWGKAKGWLTAYTPLLAALFRHSPLTIFPTLATKRGFECPWGMPLRYPGSIFMHIQVAPNDATLVYISQRKADGQVCHRRVRGCLEA